MIVYKYNGVDVFAGLARAPLLERNEEIVYTGQNISRADVITLSGQIMRGECEGGFERSYTLTKQLIEAFSDNFKRFEILDGSNVIYAHDYTIVQSISIDENRYYDQIPFQIRLVAYKDSYADSFGVLDPREEWSYDENEDQTVSISHSIGARGINNSSMAIENAKSFVNSFLGYSLLLDPVINFGSPDGSTDLTAVPILTKRVEKINRFTAEVSVDESYIYDKRNRSGNTSVLLLYSIDTEVSDGVISINLAGSIQAAQGSDISILRSGFAAINFYSLANAEYVSVYDGSGALPLTPGTFSVTENADDASISFSFSYTNDTNTDPYVVDETTISIDGAEHCISVKLDIKSDRGCPAERMRKTKAYLASLNLYSYMAAKWALYGSGKRLGNTMTQNLVSFDNLTGTITVQGTICCNSTEDCGCLENLSYTIKVEPPIPQFAEEPSLEGEGCYAIQDLNYNNRSRITISGAARPAKCCSNESVKSQVYSRANLLMAKYFQATDIVLEESQTTISIDRTIVNFSFSWNGLQPVALSDAYVYATF